MASDPARYAPWTQRSGLEPIPPQLKLGEVSPELRRLLFYAFHKDIQQSSRHGSDHSFLVEPWRAIASDLHVLFFKQDADTCKNGSYEWSQKIKHVIMTFQLGAVFNLVDRTINHEMCSSSLRKAVADAFVDARAAYRVFDGTRIAAVGTDEQADAVIKAIADAEANSATGARKHLIDAGVALKDADWAGSVRESINAVESVARRLAPGENTLRPALTAIDKAGHLHGSLKVAFDKLYGYSCNEEGVRHALVFEGEARVDEADALFMLGACASFVSYLLARVGDAA